AVLKKRKKDAPSGVHSALEKIGSAAVPGLVALLKEEDAQLRLQVTWLLVGMGKGKAALPALLGLIGAREDEIRGRTLRILAAMDAKGERVVSALTPLLRDRDPSIREEAASILARLGPDERRAGIAALMELLDDKDNAVCVRGAVALALVDSSSAQR